MARGTVGAALAAAGEQLARAGVPEPRANAEILLAQLLGTDRGGLFVRRRENLDRSVAVRLERWVDRRAGREPLQHITGSQEFHGLSFKVDRRALIPRPETEGLVDALLALDLPEAARVTDIGTGGGCIAVTMAVRRPTLELLALEASAEALALARENAALHGVEQRIRFHHGDLRTPPASWWGRMHAVVSNPPYVSEADWGALEPEVRDHDPRQALLAGPTGYELHADLAPVAFRLLRPAGHLVLEMGSGQSARVGQLLADAGFSEIDIRADLRGIPRVLVAQRGEGKGGSRA